VTAIVLQIFFVLSSGLFQVVPEAGFGGGRKDVMRSRFPFPPRTTSSIRSRRDILDELDIL